MTPTINFYFCYFITVILLLLWIVISSMKCLWKDQRGPDQQVENCCPRSGLADATRRIADFLNYRKKYFLFFSSFWVVVSWFKKKWKHYKWQKPNSKIISYDSTISKSQKLENSTVKSPNWLFLEAATCEDGSLLSWPRKPHKIMQIKRFKPSCSL